MAGCGHDQFSKTTSFYRSNLLPKSVLLEAVTRRLRNIRGELLCRPGLSRPGVVQLVECALQIFKLLSSLGEFAFCGEALVIGKIFGSFRKG
jgi:hypothetical protein